MYTLLVLIGFWISLGLVGSYLTMEFLWRRGEYSLNVDLDDLMMFCVIGVIFGPLNLVIGIIFFLGWAGRLALSRIYSYFGVDPRTTVFRARRR